MLISECVKKAADSMAAWLSRIDCEDVPSNLPIFKLTCEEAADILSCIREAEANCNDDLHSKLAVMKRQIEWLAEVLEDNNVAEGMFTAKEWIERSEEVAEKMHQKQ